MARGGKRVGTAGRGYSNRTDLNRGPRKPSRPVVAPATADQPYGAQAQQVRSLQALPMATRAAQAQTAPAASVTAIGSPAPADSGIVPGSLPALDRPTDRPNEPVTHGAPSGPGGGLEVLPRPTAGPDASVGDFITSLVRLNPSPELQQLADYVASGRG